jgi:hypothetical protein
MLALVVKRASLPRASLALRRGFASQAAAQTTAGAAKAAREVAAAGGGAEGGGGMGIGGAFRTVFSVALAGVTAAVVENTLNDLVLWNICKSHAMPVIDAHPRLQRSLVRPEFIPGRKIVLHHQEFQKNPSPLRCPMHTTPPSPHPHHTHTRTHVVHNTARSVVVMRWRESYPLLCGRAVQVRGVVELLRHDEGQGHAGELHLPPGRPQGQLRCAGGHGGAGCTAAAST